MNVNLVFIVLHGENALREGGMTWDGVLHVMEEIEFPRDCWATAELLWQSGDTETLLHMLNLHALESKESRCRPLSRSELLTSMPAPPSEWAIQAAKRLVARTRNWPIKLLTWRVARLLEEEVENYNEEQAREASRKLREPPFPD